MRRSVHPRTVAPWHRGTSHVVVGAPSRIAALLLAVAGEDRVVLPGQTTAAVGRTDLEDRPHAIQEGEKAVAPIQPERKAPRAQTPAR